MKVSPTPTVVEGDLEEQAFGSEEVAVGASQRIGERHGVSSCGCHTGGRHIQVLFYELFIYTIMHI